MKAKKVSEMSYMEIKAEAGRLGMACVGKTLQQMKDFLEGKKKPLKEKEPIKKQEPKAKPIKAKEKPKSYVCNEMPAKEKKTYLKQEKAAKEVSFKTIKEVVDAKGFKKQEKAVILFEHFKLNRHEAAAKIGIHKKNVDRAIRDREAGKIKLTFKKAA